MDTESDQSKSYFLARMSHEMRTPLNAIIGMCTIAQTASDLEKIGDCLAKINDASVHLLGMINNVLDLAKIETGSFRLTRAEADLGNILRKTTETAQFTLEAKKQNLRLDFDPALPRTVVTDEQRLAQVLDHFLSNAVKFTPPEGTISLSVKKLDEKGQNCTLGITVSDTGIGIPPEELDNIFSLFEQVDGNMDRKYGGAGMGLHLAANIVHLMGGEIHVESVPGKGSSFRFEITVERGKEGVPSPADAAGNAGEKQKFQGKSLILAEDVEINREIVLSLFENTGMSIDCAENGREALEKYKASPEKYDLILMDIHMPEMDGFEATKQIRAFEHDQNTGTIPIIAMTANVFKDDVEKCITVGMTSHLGKPIDFEELMKQLDKYLS